MITDGAVAGQNRTFAYDDIGRLTSASGPWGTGSFTYDSLGNIREKVLGARTVSFLYDPTSAFGGTGRLTSVKDTGGDNVWRSFTYDAKGNTTWHGLGLRTLAYDAAEQPTSITGNGVTGAFVYDGNLKRVKQVVNGETIYSVYGQSGALLYRDNATTGVATDYVRMGGFNGVGAPLNTVARIKDDGVTETVSYLHQNHLGSPVAATDTGGTVLWREHWTPFGEERQDPAANDNDENFTGHIRDEATGLLYMQARYMDPVGARFLSPDPVQFSDDKPQQFNRYAYTWNDPVNATDPDGEFLHIVGGAIGGALISGAVNAAQQFATADGSIGDRLSSINTNQVAIAAAGGAATGAVLAATANPVAAVAVGGAATGGVTLASDVESGAFAENPGKSAAKAAIATVVGAVTVPAGQQAGQMLSSGIVDDVAFGVAGEALSAAAVQTGSDAIDGISNFSPTDAGNAVEDALSPPDFDDEKNF